ncbi:MAG: anaerobic ribonucleoside-triphosphate reductase activating protein [Candidatus Portnoybacteria bacterium]|nr:anaerobic ribonucleoside-triphosphate reductase activating protein [Candidatus Portnoybacteria bacterium]
MKIGGLQKMSLVDYPGNVCATVFLVGCNFRCPFCQNPELVVEKKHPLIKEDDFFYFLKERKGLIDGICITGGEPTIYGNKLIDFIKKIKKMDFLIKTDTNGSNPDVLKELIKKKLVNYIAMDIKNSPDDYAKSAGVDIDINLINKSIELIKSSKIPYEFRITAVPSLVDKEKIVKIGKWIKGAENVFLQQFQNEKVLDSSFRKIDPYSDQDFKEFKKILDGYVRRVSLRL